MKEKIFEDEFAETDNGLQSAPLARIYMYKKT